MYTEDDLVKIEQAITKLQMGERVVSVAYGDHIGDTPPLNERIHSSGGFLRPTQIRYLRLSL